MPFIAITEAVFTRTRRRAVRHVAAAVDAEHMLTRSVLDGAGVDGHHRRRSLAATVKGWALLLDLHGPALAASPPVPAPRVAPNVIWDETAHLERRKASNFSCRCWIDHGHHVVGAAVSGAQGRSRRSSRSASRTALTQLDRIVAGHALALFAIELAKVARGRDAERRLQG